MSPTLNPNTDTENDVCLLWKTNAVNVGDLVMFSHPFLNIPVVKRVTASEGEYIHFRDRYTRIPEGHIWVEAEETFRGQDSKRFGPVARGLVQAKIVAIIWPLSRFRFFT